MNEDIYTALETCLTWMDQGSDLESCLARYPEFIDELRPLLMASMDAKSFADIEIPVEILKRNKAKGLIVAADFREQRVPRKNVFAKPVSLVFRLSLAAILALLLLAGIGGTGLVRASATSLPGDQFYPVKLTWENVLLKLSVSQTERQTLEDQFKQERLHEIEELISENRSAKVKFNGQVEGIFSDQIIVSGITVLIDPETQLDDVLQLQDHVQVEGRTSSNGLVIAEEIKLSGSSFIQNENSGQENDNKKPADNELDKSDKQTGNDNSEKTPANDEKNKGKSESGEDSSGNGEDSGKGKGQKTSEQKSFDLEGPVKSYDGNIVVVGGRSILINSETKIQGNIIIGSQVSIHGYVDEQGALVALKLEVKSGSGKSGDINEGGSSGSEDEPRPKETPKPDENQDD